MSSDSNQPPAPPANVRTTLPIDVASEFRALLKDTVAVARDSAHAITDAGRALERNNQALASSQSALERANRSLEDASKSKAVLEACSRAIRDLADEKRRANELEIERQKGEALLRTQRDRDVERQTRLQTLVLDAGEKICHVLDSRWSTIAVMIGWSISMIWWFAGERVTPPPSPSPVTLPLPSPPPSESP